MTPEELATIAEFKDYVKSGISISKRIDAVVKAHPEVDRELQIFIENIEKTEGFS